MKPEYCPSQGGTFTGYRPEYKDNDKWKPLSIKHGKHGIPFPKAFGGILSTINLLGFEQANALRYMFAALRQAEGVTVETRLVEYEIQYNIKAKRMGNE